MDNDVEHIFMCLFIISTSSLLRWLLISFAFFVVELFIFLLFSF